MSIDAGDTTIFTIPLGSPFWRVLWIRFEYWKAPAPKLLRNNVWGIGCTLEEKPGE